MTREGYTHIIVPTQLHDQLKTLAQQNKQSISQFISERLRCNCESARIHQLPPESVVAGSNPAGPVMLRPQQGPSPSKIGRINKLLQEPNQSHLTQ